MSLPLKVRRFGRTKEQVGNRTVIQAPSITNSLSVSVTTTQLGQATHQPPTRYLL